MPPVESIAICASLGFVNGRLLFLLTMVRVKLAPPSVDLARNTFPNGTVLYTTLMLPLESRAILNTDAASNTAIEAWGEKVAPPSVEWLNQMDTPPKPPSHTTSILPEASTRMRGVSPKGLIVESKTGEENVFPPSLDRLKKTFRY